MSSNANDISSAIQQYKVWMARIAFKHHEHSDESGHLTIELPQRAAFHLHRAGMLTLNEDSSALPVSLLAVLCDPQHEARATTTPGPLLFVFTEQEHSHIEMIPITELLLNDDVATREAALEYFLNLCRLSAPPMTPQTISTFFRIEPTLRSRELTCWRPVAVELTDALSEDFLLNLAAVKQSVILRCQQGFEVYLPRVMQPSLKGISSIDIGPPNLQAADRVLKGIIKDCAYNAKTVSDACQSYYQRLGHLPLANQYSLGATLTAWVEQHGTQTDLWYYVWRWALKSGSPLTRYHACVAFLQHPEWIPPDQLPVLWNQILMIIDGAHADQSAKPGWPHWQLRIELARYYAQYWECQVPGLEGERVASLSWWMAEQAASVLGTTPEVTTFYLEHTVNAWAEIIHLQWSVFSQGAQPSRLRYLTHYSDRMWAISLLSVLDNRLPTLHPESLSPFIQNRDTRAIAVSLFCESPAVIQNIANGVFAFDSIPQSAISKWNEVVDPQQFTPFLRVLAGEHPNTWTDPITQLPEFHQFDINGQLLTTTYLRMHANIGTLQADQVWSVINDQTWFNTILLECQPVALEGLVDAFIAIQQQFGGHWCTLLPHALAIACERADDTARCELLFSYLIRLTVMGNGASAIERILTGPKNAFFIPLARILHHNFTSLLPHATPWIAGRIRSILPSLMKP